MSVSVLNTERNHFDGSVRVRIRVNSWNLLTVILVHVAAMKKSIIIIEGKKLMHSKRTQWPVFIDVFVKIDAMTFVRSQWRWVICISLEMTDGGGSPRINAYTISKRNLIKENGIKTNASMTRGSIRERIAVIKCKQTLLPAYFAYWKLHLPQNYRQYNCAIIRKAWPIQITFIQRPLSLRQTANLLRLPAIPPLLQCIGSTFNLFSENTSYKEHNIYLKKIKTQNHSQHPFLFKHNFWFTINLRIFHFNCIIATNDEKEIQSILVLLLPIMKPFEPIFYNTKFSIMPRQYSSSYFFAFQSSFFFFFSFFFWLVELMLLLRRMCHLCEYA